MANDVLYEDGKWKLRLDPLGSSRRADIDLYNGTGRIGTETFQKKQTWLGRKLGVRPPYERAYAKARRRLTQKMNADKTGTDVLADLRLHAKNIRVRYRERPGLHGAVSAHAMTPHAPTPHFTDDPDFKEAMAVGEVRARVAPRRHIVPDDWKVWEDPDPNWR